MPSSSRRSVLRCAALVAVAATLAGTVWGTGPIGVRVRAFRSPGDYPEGLAWDGTHLWSNNFSNGTLYRLDRADGRIVDSYSGGLLPTQPEGLAWDGTNLWTCDWLTGVIQRLRVLPDAVEVEATFDKPKGSGKPVGLEWDGTDLWLTCWGDTGEKSQLYALDPTTMAVRGYWRLPVWYVEDLAFDGYHLWSADWQFGIGFAIDRATGDTLYTYRTPWRNPVGQAWDGTHLWITDTTADSIWALDISGARPTSVEPTTWSALKRRWGKR